MDSERLPFERILVPTDLELGAERAVARVPWLPLARDARVCLLHCAPSDPSTAADAGTALDQAANKLENSCRQRFNGLRVEPLLMEGPPFRAVLELADQMKAELIVLGRHRRRAATDWLGVGTTVDRVARGARVPLLMVRRPVRRSYASLLAALDRPPGLATTRAIETALRLIPQVDLAVALHATDDEISARAKGRPGVPPARIDAWRDQRRLPALRELREWLHEHHGDIDWDLHVSTAEPVRTVLRAAKAHTVDLVAVGTNSRTAVERWLLGSIAESVLRYADCDVVVGSDL